MSPKDKQRNKVQVSLTDAEYERLIRAAADEPLGSYIRRVLMRSLSRRR